jgi:hypothetical protein
MAEVDIHSEKCKQNYKSRWEESDNPLYCLGVLFSCGHTFNCMYSEEAINHDCNKWGRRINVVLWTLVWVMILLITLFPKGHGSTN